MAGVYIKGARLPDACWNCGWDPCMLWNYDRGDAPKHPDCPLVEVPDHGDLMDRDKLCKEMTDFCGKQNEEAAYTGNRLVRISWDDAYNFVENAPVVIPADKEEV